MKRLIIIGEAPNPTELKRLAANPFNFTHPLYGNPARVLAHAAGWTDYDPDCMTSEQVDKHCYKELYRRAHLRNLCLGRWMMGEARFKGQQIIKDHIKDEPIIVCLGRRVEKALDDQRQMPFFGVSYRGWDTGRGSLTYCKITLPHPSGLCREWNDPATRQRAGAVLRHAYALSMHRWP